jgi:hypothetical protein
MDERDEPDAFLARAAGKRTGTVSDFVAFLKQNRKWWLIPIVGAVLVLGALVILAGTGAAPFIYTLF